MRKGKGWINRPSNSPPCRCTVHSCLTAAEFLPRLGAVREKLSQRTRFSLMAHTHLKGESFHRAPRHSCDDADPWAAIGYINRNQIMN